jgi:hypothetical protein
MERKLFTRAWWADPLSLLGEAARVKGIAEILAELD